MKFFLMLIAVMSFVNTSAFAQRGVNQLKNKCEVRAYHAAVKEIEKEVYARLRNTQLSVPTKYPLEQILRGKNGEGYLLYIVVSIGNEDHIMKAHVRHAAISNEGNCNILGNPYISTEYIVPNQRGGFYDPPYNPPRYSDPYNGPYQDGGLGAGFPS